MPRALQLYIRTSFPNVPPSLFHNQPSSAFIENGTDPGNFGELWGKHDKDVTSAALAEVERQWKVTMKANLVLSRLGGPMEHGIAYADALNDANGAVFDARFALQ